MTDGNKDSPCPACGQGDWRPSNPVVNGFVTGCLCAPHVRLLAERDAARAEVAQYRELYQDEHDWATALFDVVEAARAMITVCQYPCGDPGKCGNCNALRAALARYDGSHVVPA